MEELDYSRIFSSQARNNVAIYLNNEVGFVTAIACGSTSFFSLTFLFAAVILTLFSSVFETFMAYSGDEVV